MYDKNYSNVRKEELGVVASDILEIIKNKFRDNNSVVVHVLGDMGAGKTALAKRIGKQLGITSEMLSPTFTIMREYDVAHDIKQNKLLHIDAYRFENKEEGNILNLKHRMRESSSERPIIIIEWPSNMHAPDPHILINIEKVKNYDGDEDSVRNIYVKTK